MIEQPLDQVRPDDNQLVLAAFEDRDHAIGAVRTLRAQGVPEERISVAVRHDPAEVTPEEMAALDQEAEATGTDVAIGGVAGGLAGFLAGLAIFSIPGLGPFLGLGVLASTLGGAALGSAAGERAAHLSTIGVPHHRADMYHSLLTAGHVVVAITAPTAEDVMVAREALAVNGALEIDVHPYRPAETAAPGQDTDTTTPGRSTP